MYVSRPKLVPKAEIFCTQWCKQIFSHTQDWDLRCFNPCEIFLSHTLIPKKEQSHVDHCNVKMTSPCRISGYSGFSGVFFKFFPNINEVLSGEQEKESIIRVRIRDKKTRPSRSWIVITRQAS